MLAAFALTTAFAARAEDAAAPKSMNQHAPPACSDPRPDCALTVNPAFDAKGRLWVAFAVGKSVYAASSTDGGKSFSNPATIATIANGVIDSHGDARPKIVPLTSGALLASYTTRPDKQMIGTIFTARSSDGGKTFSAPQPMLTEGGQRFETFVVNRKGRIFGGWLDKTHALQAKAEGKEFLGSGVAFGWSDDGGQTFKGKTLRMLPHVVGARSRRPAGFRLASGVRRQYPRPLRGEALRRRRNAHGRPR
jgi:hypothetical protein